MLAGNGDSCVRQFQRQSFFSAKVIERGRIKESVSETMRLSQAAGQGQSFLDAIQSLIRASEEPERPGGVDLRCNSGVLRVTRGVVAPPLRIIERERS